MGSGIETISRSPSTSIAADLICIRLQLPTDNPDEPKKEALSPKNSKQVEDQIAEWDRQWVEKLHEDGMNMLTVGDEKQAQWIFHFADSVSQKKYAQPSAAPKVGKTK